MKRRLSLAGTCIVTLLGCVVLAACPPKPIPSVPPPPPPPPPPSSSSVPRTLAVDSADFRYAQGVTRFPWVNTGKYIHDSILLGERDTMFSDTFPDAEINAVKLCEACARAEIQISPQKDSHGLVAADFPGAPRVVAKVVLHAFTDAAPEAARDSLFALTGLRKPGDTAYLVTIDDSAAAFMFRSGDHIAFTRRWLFEAAGDGFRALTIRQARWIPMEHEEVPMPSSPERHALGGDPRPHLSGTWLACADGCCVAVPSGGGS
ncbi:MAG: hypothetical protein ACJ8GN_22885 [Longimicrobiaceae bacterium]